MSKKILSLTNKIWCIENEDAVSDDSSDIIQAILKNRGITDVEAYKKISLKTSMCDPLTFIDMQKAVNRMVEAIKNKEKIAILGDYDVDGVSSTVLIMKFLHYLKLSYSYSIPNRMEDGYGLNIDNLKKYKDCLVVAVDCGSSSFEELNFAAKENIDVIIIDHHKMSKIPEAVAVVNPNRPDESGKYHYLCATGMVYMFIIAVNRALRESNYYQEQEIREPELTEYLDLVALATVCDVMPLVDLNRALVISGIRAMHRRKNLGIDALINLSGSSAITADTIAFAFGPKINAAGRLAFANTSVQLLMTDNPIEAKSIAQQLDSLNKERQKLEQKIIEKAIPKIDESLNFICVYGSDWHIGVIGIVAAKLKEKYHKPTFVIAADKDGKGRGSCRSVNGVDMSVIINKALQEGILSFGGGHSMAAGFNIDIDKIDDFIRFLKKEIRYEIKEEELRADCYLPTIAVSLDTIKDISQIGPFGNGNPHPKFVIPDLKIADIKIVGNGHIQLFFDKESNQAKCSFSAIAFKSEGTALGKALKKSRNEELTVQILGSLSVSEWNGRKRISLIVDDIADNQAPNI